MNDQTSLPDELTLQSALDRYLEEFSRRKSPQSYERDSRLARMLVSRLGDQPLISLSPLDLNTYRDKRLKEAAASTVARDFILLTDLFDRAIHEWGLELAGNPVNTLGHSQVVVAPARRLKPGERVRLLAACDQQTNPNLGWLVRITLETAMRKPEILELRLEDVHLKNRVAHIPKIKLNAPRSIPLTKEATRLLREAMAQTERPENTPLIFFGEPGRFGTRRPYAIDKTFRHVTAKARLKDLSFSDLREEAMATMGEWGLTEQEVAVIAGLRISHSVRRLPELQVAALVNRLDTVKPKAGETRAEAPKSVQPKEEEKRVETPKSAQDSPSNSKKRAGQRRTGGAFGVPRKFGHDES